MKPDYRGDLDHWLSAQYVRICIQFNSYRLPHPIMPGLRPFRSTIVLQWMSRHCSRIIPVWTSDRRHDDDNERRDLQPNLHWPAFRQGFCSSWGRRASLQMLSFDITMPEPYTRRETKPQRL